MEQKNYQEYKFNIDKAREFLSRREYNNALHYFNKALQINPDDVKPWNGIGEIFLELTNYDKAIDCFHKALLVNPHNIYAIRGIAFSFAYLKKYREAIEWFDKALKTSPEDKVLLNNRRVCLDCLIADVGTIQHGSNHSNRPISKNPRNRNINRHYTAKRIMSTYISIADLMQDR